jgi:hypothetical protein
MRLTLDMRDLGLVIGGPLGAWLAVLITQRMAHIRLITRILPWVFTRPKVLRGVARSEHARNVRTALEQYVDWAVSILAILCAYRQGGPQPGGDAEKAVQKIGRLIHSLHRASAESLPVVAHELIEEAKNSGFEGLDGPPEFIEKTPAEKQVIVWKPDLRNRYEAFGHIVEGDRVAVERPAVIFGGRVVERGLVRKVRERT